VKLFPLSRLQWKREGKKRIGILSVGLSSNQGEFSGTTVTERSTFAEKKPRCSGIVLKAEVKTQRTRISNRLFSVRRFSSNANCVSAYAFFLHIVQPLIVAASIKYGIDSFRKLAHNPRKTEAKPTISS
jgi:hypothetical protein